MPGRTSRSGPVIDGLEGYVRTFLLAAFRIAGGGAPAELVDRYTDGLLAGTDPGHPFAWPAPTDMSQQLVEAASIAVALHETRPWIFDRLAPAARDRVVDWLAGVVGRRTPDSNWVLFRVVVEQFLASVGGPHDPAEITGGLDRIEAWYAGDGWYSAGAGQNFDYYCGWAMLLYPLLGARIAGDTARAHRHTARLRAFLGQYQHFFAADGAPVHQGRSLTYRFATIAPLWLGALTGSTPLSAGTTRRIASGVLCHFVDRGAPDGRGLLTLGWYREFLPAVQSYSGPASPYWASKGFLGLLMPADHPVWTEVEEPAAVDTGDVTLAMPAPGWLLHGMRTDGIVRLVNHGSDRADRPTDSPDPDPHYTRLAYTSHTGPVLGSPGIPDSQVLVTGPDGTPAQRRRIDRIAVHDRFAASRFTDGPVRVTTASIVDGPCEVRVHVVEAPRGTGYTTAAPYVTADHRGGTAVYVSLIVLTGGEPPSSGSARVAGQEVTVLLPGGDAVLVRLDDQPVYRRTSPCGQVVTWTPEAVRVDTPHDGSSGGDPPDLVAGRTYLRYLTYSAGVQRT